MRMICFDLDDTLYKEIHYLKSAYREIAESVAWQCTSYSGSADTLVTKVLDRMLDAYSKGQNAFEELNRFMGLDQPISDYLHTYRTHKPKIALSEDVVLTFDTLKENGVRIGLITDGRSVQQHNKIEALELGRWIDDKDIVISEEFGSEKPSRENFVYFMKHYPQAWFAYVGDNPMKDFVGANTLGWDTVCLLDDSRNIHKQTFEKYSEEFQPKYKIHTLPELLNLIPI